ncbi:MAG: AAA family ATPase [Chloroflexi bacterium]|nr:AAA family ATPase [Chloroflexota bacterium]
MSDIFISYVEEDADVVEPLARSLIEAGYSCWYYQRSSLPGASYLQQISEALAAAKVVLLVLSPQTLDSFQVDKEISFAHECNKAFLPITRNLAWGEFQQRRPTWRLAVGTSVAIPIPSEGVGAILPRVVEGLQGLRVGSGLVAPSPDPSPAASLRTRVEPQPAVPAAVPGAVPSQALHVPPEPRPSPSLPGLLPSRAAFVGRAAEIHFLRRQFDAAAAGQGGRLVLISGEPGVGKTRLAQEAGLYAWSKGGALLEGTYLRDGTAPYGPWVEALRTGLGGLGRDDLAWVVGSFLAELSQLMPELGDQLGPSAPPSGLSAEDQRRRLFDGIAQVIVRLAERRPLVLVLNDLQWAPGLGTLAHLARRLAGARTLVLATYREQELKEQPELVQEWAELNRARLAAHLALQPLAEAESGQLIEQYLGPVPAAQLRELVHRRTHGNAFFVEEVLRSLVETGVVAATPAGWQVGDVARLGRPESMRLVILERVRRLGTAALDVLTRAAVLGQEFGLPALRELSGQPEEVLLDLLDQAISARLLVDRSTGTEERFAFADDQVQEVLYEELPPLRRRRLHLRASQALEALYAGRSDEHLEELAYHFRAANAVDKALEYALRAGQRASALAVWSQALRHFETALELLPAVPDHPMGRAEVLERIVKLETLLARPGLKHAQQALAEYVRRGDRRREARMRWEIALRWMSGTPGELNWKNALAEAQAGAAALAAEPDSVEKALAETGFAFPLLYCRLDVDGAFEHVRAGLAIAERLDDADQIAYAYTLLALGSVWRGDLSLARHYAERSREAGRRATDLWVQAVGLTWPAYAWPWLSDRAWAEGWLGRFREFREHTHISRLDRPAHTMGALLAALSGRPGEAEAELLRDDELAAENRALHGMHGHKAATALAVLGRRDEADRRFRQTLDFNEASGGRLFVVESARAYARFLLDCRELSQAESILDQGYALAHERGGLTAELDLAALRAELYTLTGRRREAETSILRAREILALPQEWRGLAAAVHRAEGLAATARGHWSEAEQSFARAIDTERAFGFVYHEAQHLASWAELYFQRNETGDRERGLEKLDQALAIFEQCAAKQDIERVLARRAEMAS